MNLVCLLLFFQGTVTTLAGGKKGLQDGLGKKTKFYHPTGLAYDSQMGILYVADHVSIVLLTGNLLTSSFSLFTCITSNELHVLTLFVFKH